MSKMIDETGHRYGNLTVIERGPNTSNGQATWKCLCDCGNFKNYDGYSLRSGKVTTCSNCEIRRKKCSEIGKNNLVDLTGQHFGRLTVIKRIPTPDYVKRETPYWECQCSCGNTCVAAGYNLRRGFVSSCGCLKSKGEEKITQLLQQAKVNFKPQYTEERFRLSTGGLPHFDFAIFDDENNLKALIEYNGEQHYKYYTNKNTWNNKENFLKVSKRDEEKRQKCKDFQIKLYEISYQKFDILEKIIYNILTEINK